MQTRDSSTIFREYNTNLIHGDKNLHTKLYILLEIFENNSQALSLIIFGMQLGYYICTTILLTIGNG